MKLASLAAAAFGLAASVQAAAAAEVKILTAGAFKQVVLALQPEFERSGHKLVVDNDTVGALQRRIDGGETFDVVVVSPAAIDDLVKKGKVADGTKQTVGRVGVGVMVRAGAPKPDVSTVDAFKKAVLDAKNVAYIDPASGGSSGIYLTKLFDQMGIAEQVKAKAKLKRGGHVSDLLVSGEAEFGIHQISEIISEKGVALVGPLPREIQNYTTYAAGVGTGARDKAAAQALIKTLSGPSAAAVLKEKGMDTGS